MNMIAFAFDTKRNPFLIRNAAGLLIAAYPSEQRAKKAARALTKKTGVNHQVSAQKSPSH